MCVRRRGRSTRSLVPLTSSSSSHPGFCRVPEPTKPTRNTGHKEAPARVLVAYATNFFANSSNKKNKNFNFHPSSWLFSTFRNFRTIFLPPWSRTFQLSNQLFLFTIFSITFLFIISTLCSLRFSTRSPRPCANFELLLFLLRHSKFAGPSDRRQKVWFSLRRFLAVPSFLKRLLHLTRTGLDTSRHPGLTVSMFFYHNLQNLFPYIFIFLVPMVTTTSVLQMFCQNSVILWSFYSMVLNEQK